MASFQLVAAVSIAAIMAHAADTEKCGGGCVTGSGKFCGLDDQCHIYSCQEWYEFGPRNFTGYDIASSTPLTCQNIQVTEPYDHDFLDGNVYYPSVSFRCVSLTPPPIVMGYTRRCTMAGPDTDFTCYELATDTDFQPFLDEVSASGLNCTDDEYDETGFPQFTYYVKYESQIWQPWMSVRAQGHNSTSEFNEIFALNGTMYATYKESTGKPTAAPTSSAPTKSLTTSPTLRMSSAFSNKRQAVSTVGTLLGLAVVTFFVSIGI